MNEKNLNKINAIQNRTKGGPLKLDLQFFARGGGSGGGLGSWIAKGCSPASMLTSGADGGGRR